MRLTFKNHPQVIAGTSERSDGSMVWWNRLPVDEAIKKNRESYFEKLGIEPKRVVAGGMAHGTKVAAVGEREAGKYLLATDVLITNVSNLFLSVTTADCLPVYFYDSLEKAIGLAHAGWRGLTAGILENVVSEFKNRFNCQTEGLQIIIGPHIRSCHYEIGEEVAVKFFRQNIKRRDGRLFANMAGEAMTRLDKLGIRQITVSPECVYEDERFYSARRDKTEPLAGMVAYIGFVN